MARQAVACQPWGLQGNPARATKDDQETSMVWYRTEISIQVNDLLLYSNLNEFCPDQLRVYRTVTKPCIVSLTKDLDALISEDER